MYCYANVDEMDDSDLDHRSSQSSLDHLSEDDADTDEESPSSTDSSFSDQGWCDAGDEFDGPVFRDPPSMMHREEVRDPRAARQITPLDAYSMFLTDDILDFIVNCTNDNANQFTSTTRVSRASRIRKWVNTNREEMRRFLGIVLYMGIVKMPTIASYWKTSKFYKNSFIPKVMSRNRFQLLLRFIHFCSEDEADRNDRLYKVSALVDQLNQLFAFQVQPGKEMVIDESIIPFRGRLSFRQYVPNKRHRYGVKLFKNCATNGYTFKVVVYSGANQTKRPSRGIGHGQKMVVDLTEGYLKKGRVVIADNYFTSVQLAKYLVARETHLVGTLRKNRKHNPSDVVNQRLRAGQITAQRSAHGVLVGKWKDKRDVLFISTLHSTQMVDSGRLNKDGLPIKKPSAVVYYNKGKVGIDLADQLASYSTPLRKTIRWYHKVAFELLLNTSLINAMLLYSKFTGKKVSILSFKEKIINSLCGDLLEAEVEGNGRNQKHRFCQTEQRDDRNRLIRRRCIPCYNTFRKTMSRTEAHRAAKKVTTYCNKCPNKPDMCINCFQKKH